MTNQGFRIGEFIVGQKIGAGASGEVWKAHHHVWEDRVVAIKILTNPESIKMMQRRELVAANLSHPGIVSLMGVDPYFDPPYVVMEYVPGTSLRPWIESRSISFKDAVKVTIQILRALVHAHAHDVIHGDLKPENIMIHEQASDRGLDTEGMVKLTDFGLGERRKLREQSIVYSGSIGNEFQAMGTIDYMSPEQRHGQPIDAMTDIYACGVVLYEMLTGSKPVGMEPPSEFNKGVPTYLDKIFRRAYARLEKRYQSAQEFLDELEPESAKFITSSQGSMFLYRRQQTEELLSRVSIDASVSTKSNSNEDVGDPIFGKVTKESLPFSYDDPENNLLDIEQETESYEAVLIDENANVLSQMVQPREKVVAPAVYHSSSEIEGDNLFALGREVTHTKTTGIGRRNAGVNHWLSTNRTAIGVGAGLIVSVFLAVIDDRSSQLPQDMLIGAVIGIMIAANLPSGSKK